MIDYASFLLEADAAKQRLALLFPSEELGVANHWSTTMAAGYSSRADRAAAKQNSDTARERRQTHNFVRDRTRTPIKGSQSAQMRQDLTVSGFVLALVFVGVIVAAHTDRPVFWLLIGPAPFAVLHTVRTFLQQRMNRREGLLESYERNR